MQKTDPTNFAGNKSINIGGSMSGFGRQSEFEHVVLTDEQAFQYSAEINRNGD